MIPDTSRHNPEPDYLRKLIDEIGYSQRAIARQLGIDETLFRKYITHKTNSTYRECPYLVQFALERFAMYRNVVAQVIFNPTPPFDQEQFSTFINVLDQDFIRDIKGAAADISKYEFSNHTGTIYFAVHDSYSIEEFEGLFKKFLRSSYVDRRIADIEVFLNKN
jgi:predicted transcriptional regulator